MGKPIGHAYSGPSLKGAVKDMGSDTSGVAATPSYELILLYADTSRGVLLDAS
jgi:hypothetical protein